jgi:hypothetical protein
VLNDLDAISGAPKQPSERDLAPVEWLASEIVAVKLLLVSARDGTASEWTHAREHGLNKCPFDRWLKTLNALELQKIKQRALRKRQRQRQRQRIEAKDIHKKLCRHFRQCVSKRWDWFGCSAPPVVVESVDLDSNSTGVRIFIPVLARP